MNDDPDYSRFTDRARKVMKLANEEAARLNYEYIGTEHVLLGLAKEGSGVAAHVLENVGAGFDRLRKEVDKLVGAKMDPLTIENRPHVPRVRNLIDSSLEEARKLNHHYVGTEHLLLGLLREREGVAAILLMNMGLKLEDVRREVLNILGHEIE
jgi:ATP-dependent Clp protease ATP-binding subunit ClpC